MHELLWRIFDRTGYADYAAAMPGGEQRTANLRMLEEKAAAYEETSYRGLYNFVRYIENLRKAEIDYGEANIGGEEADTVNIMSIHKSKGLEFPIVFVCGLHKSFNRMDVRSRVILHPDLGLGCDYTDPVLRVRIPLLMKRFLQKKTDEDNLSEELRVLYVALTRAKEKLILTGVLKGTEKKLSLWNQNTPDEEGLSYTALSGSGNCLDWIMPVVLSNPNGPFDLQFVTIEGLVKEEVKGQVSLQMAGERLLKRKTEEEEAIGKNRPEKIEQLFSWKYPFEAGRKSGGQLTVSELKKMGMEEEEAGTVLSAEPLIFRIREKGHPGERGGPWNHIPQNPGKTGLWTGTKQPPDPGADSGSENSGISHRRRGDFCGLRNDSSVCALQPGAQNERCLPERKPLSGTALYHRSSGKGD